MKTTRLLFAFLFLMLTASLASCGEKYPDHQWEWDKNESKEKNSDITALGWVAQTQFGKLPDYIQIYKAPDQLEGKKVVAFIAVADMTKATFSVLGESKGYNTPTQFYNQEALPIILNAGYFWDGASLSLICRDGKVICPNAQTASKDWVTIYYPTRGVFGLMSDGSYKTLWSYTTKTATYVYPLPSNNKFGETPQAVPSETFPAGGTLLNARTAIGGGPVLLKDGVVQNTYDKELLEISATSSQPRSAIGIRKDKKIILFVCEGRNMTPGVAGFTTGEVGDILKDLGCVDAMNLDGGGSSCMLVNGQETIKGSDGKQRPVVTAVGFK